MIHLHNHTEFSLLDGGSRVKDLVQAAKSFNMPAVAITDHGNLYGAMDFYKACNAAEIKPIIGCEFYYAPKGRFDKSETTRHHLILLAKNLTGYHNLVKLSSLSYSEGFYYKPRIDWELLTQYNEGLIAMSACIAGEIPRLIQNNHTDQAILRACEFNELFEDYYLELMDHGLPEEKVTNKGLLEISRKHNIPLVATNDTHYITRAASLAQDVLLCIGTKRVLSDPARFKFPNDQFWFKSPEEMNQIFRETPAALQNTYEIAEKCNLEIKTGEILLPKFPVEDSVHHLRMLVYKNLPSRLPHRPPEVIERLNYELSIITNMGFSDYFLIVHDIISWAKSQKIPVGPGRGSAAGSLVAYVLGITELNPLDYGLIFERFLNPSRISMPDIDSDFCFRRRDEVVDYISRRYGKDYVAQIVTFGTMASKAAIRDVGRVLEKPLADIDRLAKSATTLAGASDPELEDVLDLARQIENMPRQTGVHAAGVIIGAEPLINTIPTRISDGHVITQYDMGICEEIGLLKMDILGLKTLTVIDDALNLIPEKFDINRIPLDDQKVYHLLSNGNTVGVFQVESDGMQRILKRLKPDCFQDLIAMVALYRPGPLGSGMVEDYIECKHGRKTPVYLHPVLEPILKETHGVMLYQEQVMRIATDMAGFSLPDADLMRKAVGKKKPEVLKAQREKFIEGAEANGISKEISSQVFDLIDYFSGYGFNKSHSAAYALIAYQTAWLKAHYPREFVAALLSNTTDQDKIAVIINECRRLNIKILPPDINKSGREFMLDGDAIRFGLGAVKGLGDAVIKQILSSRPFKDPYDLAYKGLNKAAIETLAFSGCLTAFGTRRATVLSVPAILKAPTLVGREEQTLFGTGEEMLPEIENLPEYSLEEILKLEKEYLGFYVSAHPLDGYKLPPHKAISTINEGNFTVAGIVTKTKSGFKTKYWAALTIEDYTGTLEVLVFDKEPIDIKVGLPYVFKGRVQDEEGKHKLFARQYKSVA